MNLTNARELRKNATDCERLLWFHLRAHRLQGFKFKRQQPIGAYIVDFVCFEARCIVEADGGHHNGQKEYDARRDSWLKSQGFSVLRFWNNDILTNTEGVLETIVTACRECVASPSPQPLPRQGGGAKSRSMFGQVIQAPEHQNSPLPSRERGRRTMSFLRYQSYKDSGIEWLGEVQEHWIDLPLKATEGVLETIVTACRECLASPSPQPLPRQGGGAKARSMLGLVIQAPEHQNSPLPSRERGWGRGGDEQ